MVISSYREFIMLGGTLSLEDFVGTGHEPLSFTPILREDFLAYDFVVGYYQELYGRQNVLVLPIDNSEGIRRGTSRPSSTSAAVPAGSLSRPSPATPAGRRPHWWRNGCSTR